ncbi:unnamed protein product, partial [Prunus brigantina]
VWVSLDFACILFDGMLQWDIFQSGHTYKDPPSFLVLGMVFFFYGFCTQNASYCYKFTMATTLISNSKYLSI